MSSTCVNINSNSLGFAVADIKPYVPVVTSSTQGNAKLLEQLKSGFTRTVNWNKYPIDPSFQGVNRFFVVSFEHNVVGNGHRRYSIPTIEIKNYNVMIDKTNFFDQSAKNHLKHTKTFKRLKMVKEMIIRQ